LRLRLSLLSGLRSFSFDDRAADEYADIRHQLGVAGQTIGGNDLLIAAI
jgi:predicted nucleic acid-binding protein